jgi:hypothetical protein
VKTEKYIKEQKMQNMFRTQGLSPKENTRQSQGLKKSLNTISKVYKPKESAKKFMFNDLSTYLPKV